MVVLGGVLGETQGEDSAMAASLVQHDFLGGEWKAEEPGDRDVCARHAAGVRGAKDKVRDVQGLPSLVADGGPRRLCVELGYALVDDLLTEGEGRGLVGCDRRAATEQVGRHVRVPFLHHCLLTCDHHALHLHTSVVFFFAENTSVVYIFVQFNLMNQCKI